MNAPAVFFALLLTCAAGFGIALPLLAKREKIALAELAALSWLLGTAFISMAMWILGFLMAAPWMVGVTALCCSWWYPQVLHHQAGAVLGAVWGNLELGMRLLAGPSKRRRASAVTVVIYLIGSASGARRVWRC